MLGERIHVHMREEPGGRWIVTAQRRLLWVFTTHSMSAVRNTHGAALQDALEFVGLFCGKTDNEVMVERM